jgi:hypothetical protein
MSIVVTEQVVAGTLAVAAEDGQPLVFPLPEDFVWLKHFSARHLAEFFAELLAALQQAQQTDDWTTVAGVIESWKATADIEADPGVVAAIDEGLVELKEGLGVGWSSLRQELDLWRLGWKRFLNES